MIGHILRVHLRRRDHPAGLWFPNVDALRKKLQTWTVHQWLLAGCGGSQDVVECKNEIRMVALPCHQHHSLNIGVMFQIPGKFGSSYWGRNTETNEGPVRAIVSRQNTGLVILNLLGYINIVEILAHGVSACRVGCFVGENCGPKTGASSDQFR